MMSARYRRVWKRIPGTKPRRYRRVWQRIAYPTATHYSPNFTRAELDCRCGCATPHTIQTELGKLARDLEHLRTNLGDKSLTILSGYRCAAHNRKVGGASQSQHLTGRGADLGVPTGQQNRYVLAATAVPAFKAGGIGVYANGGVHVDRRGWVARWNSWSRS